MLMNQNVNIDFSKHLCIEESNKQPDVWDSVMKNQHFTANSSPMQCDLF